MGKFTLDYSDVAPENTRFVKRVMDFPMYVLSMHTDGRVGIIDDEGKPIDDETGREIARKLYQLFLDPWYVYVGKRRTMPKYKVGISRNPQKRAEALGIELVITVPCANRQSAIRAEMEWHSLMLHHGKHIKGEWFTLTEKDVEWMIEGTYSVVDIKHVCDDEVHAIYGWEDPFNEKNFPVTRRKYMKLLHRKE